VPRPGYGYAEGIPRRALLSREARLLRIAPISQEMIPETTSPSTFPSAAKELLNARPSTTEEFEVGRVYPARFFRGRFTEDGQRPCSPPLTDETFQPLHLDEEFAKDHDSRGQRLVNQPVHPSRWLNAYQILRSLTMWNDAGQPWLRGGPVSQGPCVSPRRQRLRGETTILGKPPIEKSRTDSGIVFFEACRLQPAAIRSVCTCKALRF